MNEEATDNQKDRAEMTDPPKAHYREPDWFTKHVLNRLVASLTRAGISVWGSRVLVVKGRQSGELRRVPVNLLTLEGQEYLVSARGEGQWVRNVRAANGEFDLVVGRKEQHRKARELADDEKVPVLRAYLRRWKAEVGMFFDGVSADSTDDEIRAIAHKHPAFLLDKA